MSYFKCKFCILPFYDINMKIIQCKQRMEIKRILYLQDLWITRASLNNSFCAFWVVGKLYLLLMITNNWKKEKKNILWLISLLHNFPDVDALKCLTNLTVGYWSQIFHLILLTIPMYIYGCENLWQCLWWAIIAH